MKRVPVRIPARPAGYEVLVGAGLLADLGAIVRDRSPNPPHRIALISNRKVFDLYADAAVKSLRRGGFSVTHWLMGDGERFKNLVTLEKALAFLSAAGLERTDAVVALGGGVVGDLAGFAAAIYLRGIDLVQVPTSLLAQVDASVGGKTGINYDAAKNVIGAFHQPKAVLIDTETLSTLPKRELTAGWCECVKQGAVGSRELFKKTHSYLADRSAGRQLDELERLLSAHVAFKASIVAGDEREEPSRVDSRARRILNFGHTTAHALEAVTGFRRLRHGEAVGYGMLVAGDISQKLGLLPKSELELLRDAVRLCGRLPLVDDLDHKEISRALVRDKKSVRGEIRWVLLERVGRARIVAGNLIDQRILRDSLRVVLKSSYREREGRSV